MIQCFQAARLHRFVLHLLVRPRSAQAAARPALTLLASATLLFPTTIPAQGVEKLAANVAPETIITFGPPDSTTGTPYRVHFSWAGSDLDGIVDHFDFIMVDHPRSKDSIGPGGTDPVVVIVPAPDDPRWTSTTVNDSVFVTSADTLRRDSRPGPGETPDHVLLHPFERWHTFFIRAVDDSGAADPTPAYRSFNAQSYAPTVMLLPPVFAAMQLSAPTTVVFTWDDGVPPGGFSSMGVAYRFVLIDSKIDFSHPGSIYASYPESLYTLPARYQWSDWRAHDLPDDAARRAVISGLEQVGSAPGKGYYVFAVQAMNEAGAITPVFDFATLARNNVALMRVVSGPAAPVLTVRDDILGMQCFVGEAQPVVLDIVADQPISFHWSADASHYGATITDYRYGWDIQDPDNDQEWLPWSLQTTQAPTQTFATGTHLFFLQARDNAELITQAIYELHVVTPTRSRDVLWVDDTDHQTDELAESLEDARWTSTLRQITELTDLQFDENLDVYDVRANQDEPPDLARLLDYKAVLWSTRNGANGSSGLRRVAQFIDPFPTRNQNTAGSFSILKVYIGAGGRLWINGFRPAKQLWPDERALGSAGDPVNVTNWDDPLDPHPPGVDSVGTSSLLYEMGIEMFDIGAGLGTPRFSGSHYCYDLRPAAPNVAVLQVGPGWSQGGTGGRINIEIFDMPPALAFQRPSLVPPAWKSRLVYTYASHVLEDPSQGIVYPVTADNQPMFLVSKTSPQDAYYALAFCGFEPYLLESYSHEALTRYVLSNAMGLIPLPVFLQRLIATFDNGAVRIHWEADESSDPAEFQLRASAGEATWLVPFTAAGAHAYDAIDDSEHLGRDGTVTYSLFARERGQEWMLLGQETVTLSAPPPRLQLLPPQPNPFNPSVTIAFVLPGRQHVRLDICTVEGRRLKTLVDAVRAPGRGVVIWDGTDAAGRTAPSGIYLAHLESAGVLLSQKLVLLK